ncbi:uncharacterized protein [Dendrobates tinctorius]|uniref:uncharacterized protein n=1 Tax=Dendrobates tinctorius TaxID=92724 RepID=UPI003CC9DDFB
MKVLSINRKVNNLTIRWKSCRDQHKKQHRNNLERGPEADQGQMYRHYDRLSFLEPVVHMPRAVHYRRRHQHRNPPAQLPEEAREAPEPPRLQVDEQDVGIPAPPPPPPTPPALGHGRPQGEEVEGPQELTPHQGQPPAVEEAGWPTASSSSHGLIPGAQNDLLGQCDAADFARSLIPFLALIPVEKALRTRSAIHIVLDASRPPNHPGEVFHFLERWQLSPSNLLDRPTPRDSYVPPHRIIES